MPLNIKFLYLQISKLLHRIWNFSKLGHLPKPRAVWFCNAVQVAVTKSFLCHQISNSYTCRLQNCYTEFEIFPNWAIFLNRELYDFAMPCRSRSSSQAAAVDRHRRSDCERNGIPRVAELHPSGSRRTQHSRRRKLRRQDCRLWTGKSHQGTVLTPNMMCDIIVEIE